MTPSLECGDPAPDFQLPNREGKLAQFYDRFAGNAVVLCFCRSSSGKLAEKELHGFAERLDHFDAVGGRVVVVTQDGHEANAAFASNKGFDLDILSDPVGAITRGYGAESAATGSAAAKKKKKPRHAYGLSTFVINPNQCVATAFHGGAGHAERALDCLRELQQRRSEPQLVSQQAPVLLMPDIFDPALCQRLIADWERDHFEGVITRGKKFRDNADRTVVALSVKKRRDHRLSDDTNVRVSEVVGRRVAPMLHKTFQFRVGFMQHFRVGAYSAARGDFFKPHRDNTSVTTEDRRFAMSVNLNDDYEGGAVRFPEFGGDLYRPPTGGALIFSCSLLHEAMPVTRGIRYVALTFFFAPRDIRRQPSGLLPGLAG